MFVGIARDNLSMAGPRGVRYPGSATVHVCANRLMMCRSSSFPFGTSLMLRVYFGCFVLHANLSLIRITVPCLRAPDGETRKETPERLEKAITGYVNSPFCLSFLGSSEMGTFLLVLQRLPLLYGEELLLLAKIRKCAYMRGGRTHNLSVFL